MLDFLIGHDYKVRFLSMAGDSVKYELRDITAVDLDQVWGDVRVLGDDTFDISGFSISSGDINNDGIDDLIIGAPYADTPGGIAAGEVHVIFGAPNLSSLIDLDSENPDLTVYGDTSYDFWSISSQVETFTAIP